MFTRLPAAACARTASQLVRGALRGIQPTYSAAARGEAIALISSSWQVEVAVREGNAAQVLGVRIGDEIVLAPADDKFSKPVRFGACLFGRTD